MNHTHFRCNVGDRFKNCASLAGKAWLAYLLTLKTINSLYLVCRIYCRLNKLSTFTACVKCWQVVGGMTEPAPTKNSMVAYHVRFCLICDGTLYTPPSCHDSSFFSICLRQKSEKTLRFRHVSSAMNEWTPRAAIITALTPSFLRGWSRIDLRTARQPVSSPYCDWCTTGRGWPLVSCTQLSTGSVARAFEDYYAA